jgi:hypothetical protein
MKNLHAASILTHPTRVNVKLTAAIGNQSLKVSMSLQNFSRSAKEWVESIDVVACHLPLDPKPSRLGKALPSYPCDPCHPWLDSSARQSRSAAATVE